MLLTLEVRNFILIDELELRLEPGYNVITGETGAGKSIIVGALSLVLGGRARADMVRPGAKDGEVQALFDVGACPTLRQHLDAAGIPCDGELVVRRVLQPGGRSRAYVNGRLCSLAELAAIGRELGDVTSQHESVALVDPRVHLDHLDRYGALLDQRRRLAELVEALVTAQSELGALRQQSQDRAEREAFLRFQLHTIDALDPQPGEIELLGCERSRLRHADKLASACTHVAQRLEGLPGDGDDEQGALCDALGRLVGELSSAAELDPQLESMSSELEDCWLRLGELGRAAGRYAERVESDPQRCEEVQERLHRLQELLRLHGSSLEEVLSARDRIAAELANLAGTEDRLDELTTRRDALLAKAGRMARRLSTRRRKAAAALAAAVTKDLAELGMGAARVEIEVSRASAEAAELVVDGARLSPSGIDRVQFLIAPNRGLEPRPLRRIASGGELSRTLLALKRALARAEQGPGSERAAGVQVFDEVDSGVGGHTADRIGRAMASIANHRQVLCITHLASMAAHADAHFVVAKHDDGVLVRTTIERLEGKARVSELARMLTGRSHGSTERTAADLLAAARAA